MKAYLELLQDIIENGIDKSDRTGVGTRSVFGRQIRFDLREGFPLLTTKRIHTKSCVLELLWFLAGSTDNTWLTERGVSIWNEWATPDGSLGPIYGIFSYSADDFRFTGYDPHPLIRAPIAV